tara:strand:- start:163155 stop:163670 length:516 start_codon:yes stop_codon:yes gene_type:complete
LTVLNIGPALSETVEFFSQFRCKLYFIDLFDDLPELTSAADGIASPQQLLSESLQFPRDTRFDLCLFWDLFNFLDREAIAALQDILRPHLHSDSLAHGFAVHNRRTEQCGKVYGIQEMHQLSTRPRPAALPGYSPYNQGQLEKILGCFRVTRSVLLPDSRLELLLRAKLQN